MGPTVFAAFDPTGFINALFALLTNFAAGIVNGITGLFTQVLQSFGGGLSSMFQSWGFALAAYGIWGPVMVVISLGAAGFIFYLMMDTMDVEKDISEEETEI